MDTKLTTEEEKVIEGAGISLDQLLRVKEMVDDLGSEKTVAVIRALSKVRQHSQNQQDADVAAIQQGVSTHAQFFWFNQPKSVSSPLTRTGR